MRIAVLLSHPLHSRNFVHSGLHGLLEQRGHRVMTFIPGPPRFARLRRSLRLAAMVAEEPRSQTYRHKATLRRGVNRVEAAVWRRLAGLGVDLVAWARRVEARLPIPPYICEAIRAARPDVFLWATMIHQDALENDFVRAAQTQGVPVLGAPASWDTLTTKGPFLTRPDRLIVWGAASARQAVEQHGFASEAVSAPGPPHFCPYEDGPIPPGEGVLVAGTSLHYWPDEERIIAGLRQALAPVEVAYRPHPRRRGAWDPDVWAVRRDLEPAAAIVAAFSTVVIEGALLGRPSLLVGFGVGPHGHALEHRHYDHMAHVASWPHVLVVESRNALYDGLREWLAAPLIEEQQHELRERALEVANCRPGLHERIALAIEAAR